MRPASTLLSLFIVLATAVGGCASSGTQPAAQAAPPTDLESTPMPGANLQSTAAFDQLIASIQETRRLYLGQEKEWMNTGSVGMSDADIADGNRSLLHVLQQALVLELESDPVHPWFQKIVTPWRKVGGDNADAIYHVTPIDGSLSYRITGNTVGAVYTSVTIEAGAERGGYAGRIAGVINDTMYEVDEDGNFEVYLGGVLQPALINILLHLK